MNINPYNDDSIYNQSNSLYNNNRNNTTIHTLNHFNNNTINNNYDTLITNNNNNYNTNTNSINTYYQQQSSTAYHSQLSPPESQSQCISSDSNHYIQQQLTKDEKIYCLKTLTTLMKHRRAVAFLQPVDVVAFNIPDYNDIVKHPMDFGTISTKLQDNEYNSVNAFLDDIRLVFDNCFLYNHAQDPVSLDAKKLEEVFNKWVLKRPEPQQIPVDNVSNSISNTTEETDQNNLLEQNNNILDQVVVMPDKEFKKCAGAIKELKKNDKISWPFLQPVDADAWGATDYYQIITKPMDISTLEKKLNDFEYANETEFEQDVKLMFRNCYSYNSKEHLVYQLGEKLENNFDKYWKKATKKGEAKNQKGAKKLKVVVENKNDVTQIAPNNIEINAPPPAEEARPPTILRLKLTAKPKEESKPKSPTPPTTTSPPPSTSPWLSQSIQLQQEKEKEKEQYLFQEEEEQILQNQQEQQFKDDKQQQQKQYSLQQQQSEIKQVKIPGLALSKEPPNDIGRPKLAIGSKTSPVRDKKSEKKASIVLQNHDKWLALAQKSGSVISEPDSTTTSPPNATPSTSTKLKEPTFTPVKTFNINELFDRIQGENRVRVQEKREEESLRLKSERILMEKKQQSFREQEERRKEHQEWMEIKKKKDRTIREAKLVSFFF
ncbi:unnamed protein product [Cunninghamella blakesleeana]